MRCFQDKTCYKNTTNMEKTLNVEGVEQKIKPTNCRRCGEASFHRTRLDLSRSTCSDSFLAARPHLREREREEEKTKGQCRTNRAEAEGRTGRNGQNKQALSESFSKESET